MQLVFPSSTPHPSSSSAPRPLKVHFKLPVIKKASPTVSVTNTNAARGITATSLPSVSEVSSSTPSVVPFPSSPIPCPSRKRALSEDGSECLEDMNVNQEESMDVDVGDIKGSALPFHRRISHIDIIRRRSKSCLATSYFHSDATHTHRRSHTLPDKAHAATATSQQPVKKRAVRRESMSAGNPMGKSVRRTKRVQADAQFLASMHSSIASYVRTRLSNGAQSQEDECAAQDAVLVERIWRSLVDMGFKPVLVEDVTMADASSPSPAASTSPSPSAQADAAREAAERAARRTMAVSSAPFSLDRVQELPQIPSGTLAAPQLVANLIMRHRDRSSMRPRSAATKRRSLNERPKPSRSPLSTTFLPLTDPCN